MKKRLGLAFIATLVGIGGLAHATTITAPSALIGTDALQGQDAYSWGIAVAVPTGQTIASAEIDFAGVALSASGNDAGIGVLYTDLLNSKNSGLVTASDNGATGDYWATQDSGANITSLGSEYFKSAGTTLTWSYVLNSAELTALNSYLASGAFSIGIDPGRDFTVGGITFSYTLSPAQIAVPNVPMPMVPDVATTAFLLVIGLAGSEVFRRRFVVARIKA